MKKDPLVFIKHIRDAIGRIESFLKETSKNDFMGSELLQSAVIRQIEIIGEAVKSLPQDFTNKHKEISWIKIAGMRDKLIHHYFGVDKETIWEVIEEDLPKLRKQIRKILERGNKSGF